MEFPNGPEDGGDQPVRAAPDRVVDGIGGHQLEARARLSGVLVEGRLEANVAQHQAGQQLPAAILQAPPHRGPVDPRVAHQRQRARGAAALAQRRALQQHRARVGARRRQRRHVRTRLQPDPLRRPRRMRVPAEHRHHLQPHVQTGEAAVPVRALAHRQPVLHGQGRQADEALLAGLQRQPLHAASRGIGPIQHPQLAVVNVRPDPQAGSPGWSGRCRRGRRRPAGRTAARRSRSIHSGRRRRVPPYRLKIGTWELGVVRVAALSTMSSCFSPAKPC